MAYTNYLTGSANTPDLTNYSSIYGSIPTIPAPVSTGPAATKSAMAAGGAAAGQLPGYGRAVSNIGANIASETAGQLPADVITQLQQGAAERGVSTGMGAGASNTNASYLRALGLTSLGLTGTGLSSLTSVLPSLPGYGLSQNAAFYPTSGQAQQAAEANAIYASAPNPSAAGQAALGAVQSGIGAGRSMVGGGAPIAAPPAGGGGNWWSGGGYNEPSVSVGALPTSIDQIIQAYNPANQGAAGADTSAPWAQNDELLSASLAGQDLGLNSDILGDYYQSLANQ